MKKIFITIAACLLMFAFTGCPGGDAKTVTSIRAEKDYIIADAGVTQFIKVIAGYSDGSETSITAKELDYSIADAAPADTVGDNLNFVFTAPKNYLININYKNNKELRTQVTVSVYTSEQKATASKAALYDSNLVVDEIFGVIKPALNGTLPVNATGRVIFRYLESKKPFGYKVNLNIDFAPYVITDEKTAVLDIKYNTAIKILKDGKPVRDRSVSFVGIDTRVDGVYNIMDNAAILPKFYEKNYSVIWGQFLGETFKAEMTIADYNALLQNNPDALIHKETLSFLFFTTETGQYEIICDVLDTRDITNAPFSSTRTLTEIK